MRTDDLIAALAADNRIAAPRPLMSQSAALLAGAVVSLAILLVFFGLRADMVSALSSWRFDVKLALLAIALVLALYDCLRLVSPVATGWATRASVLVPILLLAAVTVELVTLPADVWSQRLIGTNAAVCLVAIPLLSLAPLLLGLMAMRSAAPASAVAAGAAVGRAAAAIGGGLYALHCFDDSPLFVAVWYPLASLPVIAVGALAGRRLLRW